MGYLAILKLTQVPMPFIKRDRSTVRHPVSNGGFPSVRQHNEMIANVVGMLSVGISDIHSMSSTMGWTEPETSKYIRFKYVQIMISSIKIYQATCVYGLKMCLTRCFTLQTFRPSPFPKRRHRAPPSAPKVRQLCRGATTKRVPLSRCTHGARSDGAWWSYSMNILWIFYIIIVSIVFSWSILDILDDQTWFNSDKTEKLWYYDVLYFGKALTFNGSTWNYPPRHLLFF